MVFIEPTLAIHLAPFNLTPRFFLFFFLYAVLFSFFLWFFYFFQKKYYFVLMFLSSVVGLMFVLTYAVYMVATPIVGILIDKFSKPLIMLIGLIVTAISYILLGPGTGEE